MISQGPAVQTCLYQGCEDGARAYDWTCDYTYVSGHLSPRDRSI